MRWTYPNSAQNFITTIEDSFLEQLLLQPSRYCESQTSSILDLLLTNLPDKINKIEYCALIRTSDHCSIIFNIELVLNPLTKPKTCYIYDRGNHKLINEDLTKYWTHILKDLNFSVEQGLANSPNFSSSKNPRTFSQIININE